MAITSARAAAPTGADEALSAEARKHYEEGTKAFNLAEFPRAIAEFKAAYNAKPDPLLLFNIAQAFRLGGDDAQALLFYKSFLRNMPDAPNRKEVEARIRTLEKAVAEQQRQAEQLRKEAAAATTPPAVGATAPPQPSPPPSAAVSPSTSGGSAPATTSTNSLPLHPSPPPPSDGRSGSGTGKAIGTAIDLSPSAPATAGAPIQPALVPPPLVTDPNSSQLASAGSGTPAPGMPDGRDDTGSKPFYKRAWFWVAVGAVVVVTIAVAGNADKQPTTPLGLYAPTFK
jgi:hypothetical protein